MSRSHDVTTARHHAETIVDSFPTLLAHLATIVRNTCRTSTEDNAPTFTVTTQPLQQWAQELIATFPV